MSEKPFCVFPFVNQYISTQGWTSLCCDSTTHRDRKDWGKFDWHNSHLVAARRMFGKGKWPKACERCKATEESGGTSLRMNMNHKFHEWVDRYRNDPMDRPPPPVSFDIRLGNHCNLRCTMCDPESSDMIGKALTQYQKDTGRTWLENHPPSDIITERRAVDQVLANPEHVRCIQLSGGEPFIMPNALHIIRTMVENGHAEHIDLHITTNGTVLKPQWVDEWFKHYRTVQMVLSIDATGERAEYVRYGHRWDTINRRIKAMNEACKPHDKTVWMSVTPTVHGATVSEIESVFRWSMESGLDMPEYHTVFTPQWMHPGRVPDSVKEPAVRFIDSLSTADQAYTQLDSVRNIMLNHVPDDPEQALKEQQEHIRFFNHTLPRRWRDAVPELAHWDPEP